MSDWDANPAEDLQLACNFLHTWRTEGKHNIEMHCEMVGHDHTHLWRIIFGLTLYTTLVESAVMVLRGACTEKDLPIPQEDPYLAQMARTIVVHLLHGATGGVR